MSNLVEEFRAVRRVGTPIIAVSTANQPDTIRRLAESNGGPLIRWDVVRGLRPLNEEGKEVLNRIFPGEGEIEATADPISAFEASERFPEGSALFAVNAHAFISDARVSTAIGNLRDPFKSSGSTIILLGPIFDLPTELTNDVVLLSDALPDDEALGEIIDAMVKDVEESGAKLKKITKAQRQQAICALRGLSSFAAEQQAFLSLRSDSKGGLALDLDSLWARKVETISSVPGLEMQYTKTNRDSVRGLKALMTYFERLFREENPERPQAVLHIDEIDKALAGSGAGGGLGDSSGVTQDQIGQVLQTMEEKGWDGLIPVGPPGTGKTLVSKTIAGLNGVPYLRLDMGALKGSLVGESEARIRLALETIDRIGGGRVLVLATCNRLDALPPELKRRFTAGIWYFDLPTPDERVQIWDLYAEKYGLEIDDVPEWSALWTGAEIRNVCRAASRLGVDLDEAKNGIVPIHLSGKDDLDRLRKIASGKFLDAARGGVYTSDSQLTEAFQKPSRKVSMRGAK